MANPKRHGTQYEFRRSAANRLKISALIQSGVSKPTEVARALNYPRGSNGNFTMSFWRDWKAVTGAEFIDSDDRDRKEVTPPKSREGMSEEALACLRDTPEGFRQFCDTVWPDEPMPAHVFTWVQACYDYGGDVSDEEDRQVVGGAPDPRHDQASPAATGPSRSGVSQHRKPEVAAYTDPGESPPAGVRQVRSQDGGNDGAGAIARPSQAPRGFESPPTVGGSLHPGRWKPSVVLNVPPDHAKSSYFSKRWPVWRICQDRDWQILIISATNELASQFIGWIAAQLEENEKLIEMYGGFRSDDKSCSWQPGSGKLRPWGSNLRGAYRIMSRGKEQQKQGLRAREVVIDDMIEPDDVLTAERRAKDSHEYHSVILSRVRGGITRVIGTRQHPLDIYDELSKERDRAGELVYEHINFPALRDPLTGTPSVSEESVALWDCAAEGREHRVFSPSGWPDCCRPADFLLSAACYGRVGESAFQLTYQQVPAAEGSTWFKREWLEGCRDFDRVLGQASWPREECVRVVSYDPAPTQQGVAMIMNVRRQREIFEVEILDIERRKGFDPEDFWALLEQWNTDLGPIDFVIPERNSWNWFDKHPIREWCARRHIQIKKHFTGVNKLFTDLGLRSLDVDFQFGRIRLPYGDDEARFKTIAFINEAEAVPYGRLGTRPDQLMALWIVKPHFKDLYVLRGTPRKAHSHWTREKPNVWGKRSA